MPVVLGDKKLHIMQHDKLLLQHKHKDSAAIKYNSFCLRLDRTEPRYLPSPSKKNLFFPLQHQTWLNLFLFYNKWEILLYILTFFKLKCLNMISQYIEEEFRFL